MTFTEWITQRLRAANSPYADFVHDGLEWQIQPTDDEALLEGWIDQPYRLRIPKDGRTNQRTTKAPFAILRCWSARQEPRGADMKPA